MIHVIGEVPVEGEDELGYFLPEVLSEVVDHVGRPDDATVDVLEDSAFVIFLESYGEVYFGFLVFVYGTVLF